MYNKVCHRQSEESLSDQMSNLFMFFLFLIISTSFNSNLKSILGLITNQISTLSSLTQQNLQGTLQELKGTLQEQATHLKTLEDQANNNLIKLEKDLGVLQNESKENKSMGDNFGERIKIVEVKVKESTVRLVEHSQAINGHSEYLNRLDARMVNLLS